MRVQDPAAQATARLQALLTTRAVTSHPDEQAVRMVAEHAFGNTRGDTTKKFHAASDAVGTFLADGTPATKAAVQSAVAAAHPDPTTATPATVAAAATASAARAATPTGAITLSQPSMLGPVIRIAFAGVASVLAALAGVGLYFLDDRHATSTAGLVGLTIGLAASLLTVLVLVMGYGKVSISIGDQATDKGGTTS